MKSLSYQQFIDGINNGQIVKVVFQVKDYAHYKYCSIERIVEVLPNSNSIIYIYVKLAKDCEQRSFFKTFDEKYKLFDMKRKGTFTLKQMWDRIEVISIDYAS